MSNKKITKLHKSILLIAAVYILSICVNGIGMITPTRYPKVSTLSFGLKSLFTFYFSVDTSIIAGNYIKIKFEDFSSISPNQCQLLLSVGANSKWQTAECTALNGIYLFVKIPGQLLSGVEQVLQIDLLNTNPISSESKSYSIWTVSSLDFNNFFVYDLNTNFAQFPFTSAITQNKNLGVSLLNFTSERYIPGASSTFFFSIRINQQIGDNQLQAARLVIICQSPWMFQNSSLVLTKVSALADPRYYSLLPSDSNYQNLNLYKSPSIISYSILSPNQLEIVFNESFQSGRSFQMSVTNLLNPTIKSQGTLKVYTMNYGSNVVIEKNENLATLEIFQNLLTVQILTGLGVSPNIGPINFYKHNKQYIQLKFSSPTIVIPNNYIIKVSFGVNQQIIKGTAYIAGVNAYNAAKPILYQYDTVTNTLTISNIQLLSAGTFYTISCRLLISNVDAYLVSTITIDVDQNAITPIFKGQTNQIPLLTNGNSSLVYVQGQQPSDPNGQITIGTVTSSLIIGIKPSPLDSITTSKFQIYTSFHIKTHSTFSSATSCTIRNEDGTNIFTFTSANITTVANVYTIIELVSPTGTNYYTPSTAKKIQCDNLLIEGASNDQNYIYEFFFRMTKQNTQGSPYIDWMSQPVVQYAPNANFYVAYMNDLNGVNSYIFPSLINLVATSTSTFSSLSLLANEVPVITAYAMRGLKSLVQSPVSQSTYPCGSNLLGVSCEYIEGDQTTIPDLIYYPGWDRVNIYLPNTNFNTKFHVIFPDLFSTTLLTYNYKVLIGKYNTLTRVYTYLFANSIAPIVTANKAFDPLFSDVLNNLKITLAGYSGSYIDDVSFQLASTGSHTGNTATQYGAAVILVTDWELWFQGKASYKTVASPLASDENAPLSFNYFDQLGAQHFVTVFPVINTGQLTELIKLNQVALPFSYDLPNHNIYVTDKTGSFVGYKQYFNAGPNVFYKNYLKFLDISCDDMSAGNGNTFCSFNFVPNFQILGNAKIYIQMYGMQTFTSSCSLQYESSPNVYTTLTTVQSCTVSLTADLLILTLNGFQTLPENVNYKLQTYGVSLLVALQQYFILSVRDSSGNFVIEEQTKIITTKIYIPQYIYITEIVYSNINPYVFSSLTVKFTIPRNLYPNENVQFNMGTDLNDVNTNTDRLSVKLVRVVDNYDLNIAVQFVNQLMNVLFFNRNDFVQGNYILSINNIRNPASNQNDFFKILFVRQFDQTVTLYNTINTTASINPFVTKTNSDIQLISSKYLQEGALQELVFKITMQISRITSNTRIYVSFPLYYSPAVTNFADLLFCKLNTIQISCQKDNDSPYKIVILNSPLNIEPLQSFNLSIFGIITPQFTLRNDVMYNKETLFLGLDGGPQFNYYYEFIHLTPPPVNPGLISKYLYLQSVFSSSLYTGSLSNHTIKIFTDSQISANVGIILVFPKEYSTLVITSILRCYIYLEDGSRTPELDCSVDGRSLSFGTQSLTIPALSYFWVNIANVPTPPYEGSVDYNTIIIQVYNLADFSIITRNFYLTNRMLPTKFIKLQNVLKVNNDQIINVMKGTFSKAIPITTFDNSRFITNIEVQAISDGFTFLPSQMFIYLGDFDQSFRIGANKDLQVRAYALTITKTEKYYKTYYSIASSYIIFVNSIPLNIPVSSQFSIPRGGCSLPEIFKLSNAPFMDVNIAIQYDYQLYPQNYFVVDLDLSSYVLQYNSSVDYRYISFCVNNNTPLTITMIPIYLQIGGTNFASYQLQNKNLTLNIVDKVSVLPTISLKTGTIKKTQGDFDVTINTDGTLFYHLYIQSTSVTLSLTQLKFNLKQQTTILASQSDVVNSAKGIRKDERIGLQTFKMADASKQIILQNLQPETNYVICAYYENEFKQSTTQPTCLSFKTDVWQLFSKVSVWFSKKNYQDSYNDLLCYFVRGVKTRIYNVISQEGGSCSFGVSPAYQYYNYPGLTFSFSSDVTNIYLIPDIQLETDDAITNLQNFYGADGKMKSAILQDALNNSQIDFIANSFNIMQFKYQAAIEAQSPLQYPSIQNLQFSYLASQYQASVIAKSIKLSQDGTIYFIMERTGSVLYDEITQKSYVIPVSIPKIPSTQQVIQCLNGRGYSAEFCIRAIYSNNATVDAEFVDLLFNSQYTIYYVIANEYPLYPVVQNFVYTYQVTVGPPSQPADIAKIQFFFKIALLLIFISFIA